MKTKSGRQIQKRFTGCLACSGQGLIVVSPLKVSSFDRTFDAENSWVWKVGCMCPSIVIFKSVFTSFVHAVISVHADLFSSAISIVSMIDLKNNSLVRAHNVRRRDIYIRIVAIIMQSSAYEMSELSDDRNGMMFM